LEFAYWDIAAEVATCMSNTILRKALMRRRSCG
jgi:hypothetical protein